MLEDVAATPILANAATEVGANMARIIDADIQDTLESTGTNVIYANGNVGPRSNLGSGDTLKAADLAKATAFLSTKGARQIGKGYVGVIHPNVAFDLMQQTGTGTFIDLNKYTDSNANKPLMGEVGMLFGVRIVTSSWIQTFASTVTVYPTYVMGVGAYGVATLKAMNMYVTGGSATDSDPLAQRRKVGAKISFNSIILQQDALVRIESASTLSYTFL
jgi:N4-gp56 family major capsid protein